MATDLEKAYKAIRNKRPELDRLHAYYNGPQPLKYSTERLKEAFDDIKAHFEINWCAVVVDSTLDRLEINGFDLADEAANQRVDYLFSQLHIDIEADKAHLAALSMKQAYLILWKNADGEIELYYNDPRICHVFYDSAKPKLKTYAAKWFRRDDDRHQITLYYPDRLEHYVSKSTGDDIDNPNDFMLDSQEPNPYGAIPVFQLTTPGETVKILTLQDAINKMMSDMMVSAEFGAYVQRFVISQGDPGELRNGPNQIWWIPSGDGQGQSASVGQFTPTALNGYLDAMDKLANAIAIITRTPKHYFLTTGANVSGDALLVMESPLVKKVHKRQMTLTADWQDVIRFLLQLDGLAVDKSDITISWESAQTVQPYAEAQTRQLAVNTGIPLVTQLKREGWTESDIEALLADRKSDQAQQRSVAQAALNELRIQQEQDNDAPAPESRPV